MKVSIHLSNSVAYLLGSVGSDVQELEIPDGEATLRGVLLYLAQNWNPRLKGIVIDAEASSLKPNILVAINNVTVALLDGLDTPLSCQDRIKLGLFTPAPGG